MIKRNPETPKPRNFVAKNAKMGGAGAHKDKKKAQKQGNEKHKKPYAEDQYFESLESQLGTTISEISRGDYYSKAHKAKIAAAGKLMFADPAKPEVQKAMRDFKNRSAGMARASARSNAELKAKADQMRQQSLDADRANLPNLQKQLDSMISKFELLGGDSYQYADRMSDRDREAQQLHGQIRAMKDRIAAAGGSGGMAEGVMGSIHDEVGKMMDKYIAKYKQGLLDADHLMHLISKTAGLLAKRHNLDIQDAEQLVSNYVEDNAREEAKDAYMESLAQMVAEKLPPTADVGDWVTDFKNADPNKYHQFRNKSDAKKQQMAIAAYYDSKQPKKKKKK